MLTLGGRPVAIAWTAAIRVPIIDNASTRPADPRYRHVKLYTRKRWLIWPLSEAVNCATMELAMQQNPSYFIISKHHPLASYRAIISTGLRDSRKYRWMYTNWGCIGSGYYLNSRLKRAWHMNSISIRRPKANVSGSRILRETNGRSNQMRVLNCLTFIYILAQALKEQRDTNSTDTVPQ